MVKGDPYAVPDVPEMVEMGERVEWTSKAFEAGSRW